jgi:hypothetical protein
VNAYLEGGVLRWIFPTRNAQERGSESTSSSRRRRDGVRQRITVMVVAEV